MFHYEKVTSDFKDLKSFKKLYHSAFPACERRSLSPLLAGEVDGSDMFAFYDDDVFCGLACLLTVGSITHIIYIAICEELRSRHYGSAAITEIRCMYPQNTIIADLEADNETAKNHEQRQSRIRFYKNNGFEKTSIAYRWCHENYVIYALGEMITENEFDNFWKYYYDGKGQN
ncbi:MAG: GNAT family N-acetyltransferase [Hespellia sp.]|nr:GNAT family N-acetyltransferase [Hespellia sp.]